MNNTQEIITLQFGNFANYVGTHYWNIQEHSFNYDPDTTEISEINNDVLFREGTHNKSITYTPRMLLVDLKGSLKYVSEEGNLYTSNQLELNNPENKVLDQVRGSFQWDDEEKIEVMEEEEIPMPSYQKALTETGIADGSDFNLKESISNWADFMYTRYHPRSINVVKQYEYQEDTSTLDTFTAGRDLWSDSFFEDDYCDKIRNYIEECDHCQGFQSFFDAVDGFAGVALKSMEYLQDEYGKSILAIPLLPPRAKSFPFADEAMSDSIRVVNLAFSYARLYEHSSLIVPLSTINRGWRTIGEPKVFPFLNYEPENLYHSSSIIASFLDTMSTRYRLKDSSQSYLSNFCAELNIYNRKLCGAKVALPMPINEKEDLIEFLDKFDGELMQSLSPGTKIGTDRIVQSVTLRGIPKSRLKRPLEKAQKQMKLIAYKCSSISEMLQLYYQCNLYASLSNVSAIESSMKIQSPFPYEIFDNRLNTNGFVREFLNEKSSQRVMEVPVMTAVQNSSELYNTLDSLHEQVARIKIAKIPRFVDSNLETEEFMELLEELLLFKEQYEDNSFL